jgi:hypothetical protein
MPFEVVGEIAAVVVLAKGLGVRTRARMRQKYGTGRWRKLKGVATICLDGGRLRRAELHWYEAHGVGRVMMKIKRFLA